MKKIFYILFIMLFTSFFSFASAKVNIAYINVEKVLYNFSTWNNFAEKIEQHAIKVRDIATKKEKDIEKIWFKIKKMRDNNQDTNKISVLEKDLNEKNIKLQKYFQYQKKQMEIKFINIKRQIQGKITKIINKIAKNEKIDMVINTNSVSFNSSVVYLNNRVDITDKVIEILNKEKMNLKLLIDVNGDGNE
ncbi:MAG: OmpH family outer membrane protein [Alphaproteobacteria bacterium]